MIARLTLLLALVLSVLQAGGAQAHEPVAAGPVTLVALPPSSTPILEPRVDEARGFVIERCRRPHPSAALDGPVGCGTPVAMVPEFAPALATWPVLRLVPRPPPDVRGRDPAPDRRPPRLAA